MNENVLSNLFIYLSSVSSFAERGFPAFGRADRANRAPLWSWFGLRPAWAFHLVGLNTCLSHVRPVTPQWACKCIGPMDLQHVPGLQSVEEWMKSKNASAHVREAS